MKQNHRYLLDGKDLQIGTWASSEMSSKKHSIEVKQSPIQNLQQMSPAIRLSKARLKVKKSRKNDDDITEILREEVNLNKKSLIFV